MIIQLNRPGKRMANNYSTINVIVSFYYVNRIISLQNFIANGVYISGRDPGFLEWGVHRGFALLILSFFLDIP